jgi:membrane-associated PAP2 superfamily phosphatase
MEPAIAVPARAPVSPAIYVLTHVVGISFLLAFIAEFVNRSGLDIRVAAHFFDAAANVFPWRTSRILEIFGHRMVLALPVGVAVLAFGAALASYRVPALRPWRAVLWGIALTCALGQIGISLLKHHTALPRPYNVRMFGGYVPYPTHWWAHSKSDAGGALPSGHAGAGYALLALYFAGWAAGRPAWRWGGLAIGIVAGLGFSAVRIVQGAHFLSQTLWSAAFMWLVASVVFYPAIMVLNRTTPAAATTKTPART